jgi:hypothetical protein
MGIQHIDLGMHVFPYLAIEKNPGFCLISLIRIILFVLATVDTILSNFVQIILFCINDTKLLFILDGHFKQLNFNSLVPKSSFILYSMFEPWFYIFSEVYSADYNYKLFNVQKESSYSPIPLNHNEHPLQFNNLRIYSSINLCKVIISLLEITEKNSKLLFDIFDIRLLNSYMKFDSF